MRIMNFMLKSIIILMLIVLVGCNNDNKNNNTNGNNKAGLVQLKNDNQDEGELVYSIKKGKIGYIKNTIKHIATYSEYLTFISNNKIDMDYDEDFFNESGLIVYSTYESSGSNIVNVTSVELENNNIIVNITKMYPEIGTCDIAFHSYIIEYQKQKDLNPEIYVNYTLISFKSEEIIISQDNIERITQKIKLLKEERRLQGVEAFIWFKDNFDSSKNMTRSEIEEYFTNENNKKVNASKINELDGSISISYFSPTVLVTFNDFNETELQKLLDVAKNDYVSTIYLKIHFNTINNIREKVN